MDETYAKKRINSEKITKFLENPVSILIMHNEFLTLTFQKLGLFEAFKSNRVFCVYRRMYLKVFSVLHTLQASGEVLNEFIVCKRMDLSNLTVKRKFYFSFTAEDGKFTDTHFLTYIHVCFKQYLKDKEIPLPVILFVENLGEYLNAHIIDYCNKIGVYLVSGLPYNCFNEKHNYRNAYHEKLLYYYMQEWLNKKKDQKDFDSLPHFPEILGDALKKLEAHNLVLTLVRRVFVEYGWFPLTSDSISRNIFTEPVAVDSKKTVIFPYTPSTLKSVHFLLGHDIYCKLVSDSKIHTAVINDVEKAINLPVKFNGES